MYNRKVTIRPYKPEDCDALVRLLSDERVLRDTVPVQLDRAKWNREWMMHKTFVAELAVNRDGGCGDDAAGGEGGRAVPVIVGFGELEISFQCSMACAGQLRRLCVGRDYIRQGIGSRLLQALERCAAEDIVAQVNVYAPATSRAFFEACGYTAVSKEPVGVEAQPSDVCPMYKQL